MASCMWLCSVCQHPTQGHLCWPEASLAWGWRWWWGSWISFPRSQEAGSSNIITLHQHCRIWASVLQTSELVPAATPAFLYSVALAPVPHCRSFERPRSQEGRLQDVSQISSSHHWPLQALGPLPLWSALLLCWEPEQKPAVCFPLNTAPCFQDRRRVGSWRPPSV